MSRVIGKSSDVFGTAVFLDAPRTCPCGVACVEAIAAGCFNDKRVQFPAACGVRNIYEEGGTI
jgi:hypothetical protein